MSHLESRHLRWSAALALAAIASTAAAQEPLPNVTTAERRAYLQKAQVWKATDIAAMDVRNGPPGGFAPHQEVACDYVPTVGKPSGTSPKFECALAPGDVVKVKYRETNGEVFAEVAATRLFWALGFGADAAYHVRLTCRNCPADPWAATEPRLPTVTFEHATIERKMAGVPIEEKPAQGWDFAELDLVQETAGGAPHAQREALRLLAAFVQHGDNKAENQRFVCLPDGMKADAPVGQRCTAPFLLVHDLGNTFGRGNLIRAKTKGSANFTEWSGTPLWRKEGSCEARLGASLDRYTLKDPVVTEAARRFLASLLTALTDQQIRDMFEVANIDARIWKDPEDQHNASIDAWVAAFKQRREQLVKHACPR